MENHYKASHIFSLIANEQERQELSVNLIASENYASPNVLRATGSILTNKYAEGYPGRRYYSGCQVIDEIESLACDLGKRLFNAEHVNVQPHSGSSANFAVYLSHLKPGDTVMGMAINAGGHLTHGHKVNFSGKMYNFVGYGVSPENEMLDYDEIEILAQQNQPKMIVAGASAYSRSIDFARLADIARSVNALLFIDMAHIAGLVAAGVHPNPLPYADIVSSTTHKTLRGPRGGLICSTSDQASRIDKAIIPGAQGGPLLHVIAAKAIAFQEALTNEFKEYQRKVVENAQTMAHEFKNLGYRIVTGGTDNHLFMIDLQSKNLPDSLEKINGATVERVLESCSINVNRNLIPFDKENPMITSGIRIGTPAITTRGFGKQEVLKVVHLIDDAIKQRNDSVYLQKIQHAVESLCKEFPIYKN